MGDGLKPVGPELPAGLSDGDGSLGVLEGHMSGIYHDGKQQYRYWMRDDVQENHLMHLQQPVICSLRMII